MSSRKPAANFVERADFPVLVAVRKMPVVTPDHGSRFAPGIAEVNPVVRFTVLGLALLFRGENREQISGLIRSHFTQSKNF